MQDEEFARQTQTSALRSRIGKLGSSGTNKLDNGKHIDGIAPFLLTLYAKSKIFLGVSRLGFVRINNATVTKHSVNAAPDVKEFNHSK